MSTVMVMMTIVAGSLRAASPCGTADMHRASCQLCNSGPGENGTALAMAMLFLVVLTILGVAAMRAARQEMLIAGNVRLQNTALGNTEYVLAAGEQDVMQLMGNPFSPDIAGDHYYPTGTIDFNPVTPRVERPGDRAWTFNRATVQLPDLDNDGLADDGSGDYCIQDAGLLTLHGEDASVNGSLHPLPGARLQAFRVTARTTQSRGTQRTVQSVIVREPVAARQ
jgi:Tfp pilus assembly protein PilX